MNERLSSDRRPFRIRWLGRVRYRDALAFQRGIHHNGKDDHLLLLEHHPVYTLGARASLENVLAPPEEVHAELERTDRGGDVTFHGPGQLVAYPLLHLSGKRGGGIAETVAYVRSVEAVIIQVCIELGLEDVGRLDRYPGVWVEPTGPNPRKLAAIGVRLSRGRTMHGFALNVDPDLSFFDRIVPCGITDHGVTSLVEEGLVVTMQEVTSRVALAAAEKWAKGPVDRADVSGTGMVNKVRVEQPKASGASGAFTRKPEWMRVKLDTGPEYRRLKSLMREKRLVTVCEEARCPNVFECWNDGTATFMINGERCTRACGFCMVDTQRPEPLDDDEPDRVASAVADMKLSHAVVTAVARDDLPDGGAAAFAATIAAIRKMNPTTGVEVLIPDFKGDPAALQVVFDARPDVLNHNIETVARLQRRVRPSAGYARSLSVLSRARAADLSTKSSLIVGLGETDDEVEGCLADLAAVDCKIVTIGQYLQPSTDHLAVERWVDPPTFESWRQIGLRLGISHIEAGPLTRSSYHARQAADRAGSVVTPVALGSVLS